MREMPQLPIQIEHLFSDGLYARKMTAPKDALLVGKMHKGECLNVVTRGSILVWTEKGSKRIDAPCIFSSPPGTKRVGLCLSEVEWTTFHPNPGNEKNLDLLEDSIIRKETPTLPPRNPEIEPIQNSS